MKTTVYLLESDFIMVDTIKKRFLIDTISEIKGASNDAGSAYAEIQTIKPDVLIFAFPMNFSAEQLLNAMLAINPKMHLIALLEKGHEAKVQELNMAGIKDVFQKPFDCEALMETINRIALANSNPFGSIPSNSNPFGGTSSPFGQQMQQPQFGGAEQTSNSFGFNQQQNSGFNNGVGNTMGAYSPQMGNGFNGGMANQGAFNGGVSHQGGFGNQQSFGGGNEYQQGQGVNQSFKTLRQNILAIHCPKGGVGKTSISTNVASLLSTVKIGKQPLNVLLVDFDWAFGDVCVNLGLQSRPNVMNWVNDIKARRNLNENADMNFTQAQIEQHLITYKTGLKILAAPANHNDILDIPDDVPRIIIDNLKNNCNFDVIIFDCGNNTDNHTLQALLSVHAVYEVITMDVSAMSDLSKLMATLKSISFPINKMKLVVNKLPKTDREYAIEDISETIGLEVAAVIPDNEKVRVHNNEGEPLSLSKTTNPFTEAIKQTANTMLGNNIFAKKGSKSSKSSKEGRGKGFLSFLKR